MESLELTRPQRLTLAKNRVELAARELRCLANETAERFGRFTNVGEKADELAGEVSQPRVTCYRIGIRMNEPRMVALLVAHHRPGFYFRVLQEGEVGAGDDIVKMVDGPERITVCRG